LEEKIPHSRVNVVDIPDDPGFPKMYPLYNRGQLRGTFDADIDAPEAWAATTGSPDTVVAVIDTGMDINHPDLRDSIWTNPTR
jgi:subtilisin family serine protease